MVEVQTTGTTSPSRRPAALTTPAASAGIYVDAEDVRRSPFRVSVTPLPSLNRAMRSAVGGGSDGTPQAWCDAIRKHLRAADYETLAPFVRPCPIPIPGPLLGLVEAPGESFKDAVERLIATPSELLAEEIARCRALVDDGSWDVAARDPGRWLRRHVAMLLRAWKGFGPIWDQARPALDREVERIGTATALDAQLELLDGLLPSAVVQHDRWCVTDDLYEGPMRFPDSGVVLTPLVANEASKDLVGTDDILGYVSYPVRSVLAREPQPPAAALEALLGIQRAQILRALGRPTSIGTLADLLRAVPSAATHHVNTLQAAGLVERSRRGRNVLVDRTARGEALLELYGGAATTSTTPPRNPTSFGRHTTPTPTSTTTSPGDRSAATATNTKRRISRA
jgi:DNA-binding transcriptional ArsR family regulator